VQPKLPNIKLITVTDAVNQHNMIRICSR